MMIGAVLIWIVEDPEKAAFRQQTLSHGTVPASAENGPVV
jgi:hypothetical protein